MSTRGRQRALVRKCPNDGKTKAEAYRLFGELLARVEAETEAAPDGLSVAALCDHFRDRLERENALETQRWYFRHLKSFLAHVGPRTLAAAILPLHVTAWLGAHDWNETTRHGAITARSRRSRRRTAGRSARVISP